MSSTKGVIAIVLLAASLTGTPVVGAQVPRPSAGPTQAQAERNAVELKQGMSADEVQRLLGKPWRTAFKGSGGLPSAPSQGTLHWTYNWISASTPAILHVEFTARTPDTWSVNSWEWASY